MSDKPYKDFGDLLSEIFPYKVQKITIDAGFTCPNRDGSKGFGGCTYCNNQSFSPNAMSHRKTATEQLQDGVSFFAHKEKLNYLAYFQSYTNTYDKIENLIAKYEEALKFPGVVGLIVGTRPDCMPDELLDYFSELKKRCFLLVEYGLESTLNSTLQHINRGHSYEESVETIYRTVANGIYTGVHLILGLPNETRQEMLHHAEKIAKLPLTTIKLHQLQIIKGTQMEKEFQQFPERFQLFEVNEYIDLCVDFAEKLNPDFYIDRFISQSPKELLIAPDWGLKNFEFTAKILKRFNERETWQGQLFTK